MNSRCSMTYDPAPGFAEFREHYEQGRGRLLWRRGIADLETPVAAYLKLARRAKPNTFLLESVEGGAARGRYSIIGLKPDLIWRCPRGAGGDQPRRPRRALCLRGRSPARRWRACARWSRNAGWRCRTGCRRCAAG